MLFKFQHGSAFFYKIRKNAMHIFYFFCYARILAPRYSILLISILLYRIQNFTPEPDLMDLLELKQTRITKHTYYWKWECVLRINLSIIRINAMHICYFIYYVRILAPSYSILLKSIMLKLIQNFIPEPDVPNGSTRI